ncbi:histidine kinase [Myroides albus]|uniref:sensor histidine kinase n=1 Tax=Myroides albus TaxID=2562892 RepID=UPI00215925EA|nr:tetratricopeptide repeat-containing sensor histidine kinase [Myroides albus]UVD79335.1 histidine kinase [Myroides albus]
MKIFRILIVSVRPYLIGIAVVVVCTLSTSSAYAQSLQYWEKQYKAIQDKNKAQSNIVISYLSALYANKEFEQAERVLTRSIDTALKSENYSDVSILYCIQAMNLRIMENTIGAEKSLDLAKQYSIKANDAETKGYLAYSEGWLSSRNGYHEKAVEYIITAIKHYESAPNSNTLNKRKSVANSELSVIYNRLGEEELNEKYAKASLSYALLQHEPQTKFSAFMQMGNLYDRLYSTHPDHVNYRDLSERYFLQSIDIFNQNKEVMYNLSDLSFANNNLASLYLYSFPDTYRCKALEYAKKANAIALKTQRADHIASSYGIISSVYLAEGDAKRAISYLLEAKQALEKSSIADRNIELNIYESLVEIYAEYGNYKEAFHYQQEYLELFKKLYNQDKLEIVRKLEAQFDKERQQQRLVKLQYESEKNKQQIALMHVLAQQREQLLSNLKLIEENQRSRLKFSELEAQKNAQQLRLSQLETEQKNKDLLTYKSIVAYKDKLNTFYVASMIFFIVVVVLLLYAYRQRLKTMKQRDTLHHLAIEKEKQNSKISTLTALLQGQEQERGRLARDLHDGLGGLLSGTKLHLTQLYKKVGESAQEGLNKSVEQIDAAVTELRKVAHNLMPDLLVNYGLKEALDEFGIRMSNETLDIHIEFLSYTSFLSQDKQLLVYRIIQELVNNAIKHAEASQIIIQLVEEEHEIIVTVEDDGKGFDTNKLDLKKSAGFHNIQSRIQFMKGTLAVHSEENIGTSVEFKFPKK